MTRSRLPLPLVAVAALLASAAAGYPAAAEAAAPVTIAQIQGTTHRSPLEGQQAGGVEGVVTAVGGNGFWMQSTSPDTDPATSEGIFVYAAARPTVTPGQRVRVAGTVTEFRPGGADGQDNLSTTQLSSPQVEVVASGVPLPAPVVLGVDRVAPQQNVASGDPINVEKPDRPLRPETDALDFDESLEGMRVGVRDAVAAGPTAVRYGELVVVPGQRVSATRSRAGGVVYGSYRRPNAMRITLDDPLLPRGSMPAAATGDRIPGTVAGVLDYGFANYRILLTDVPRLAPSGLQREVTAAPAADQLAVATFNVENLSPTDQPVKYRRLAAQITTNLRSPDLLALEEIQDNSGAADDGVVSSTTTVAKLVAAIKAAGGPAYEARWVDPENDKDGGQPGGNIRQVLLYRTDRGLAFVDRPGGDATTPTEVTGSGDSTALTRSPGRVAPGDAAWTDSRKPLAAQLRWRGRSVFLVANHFASKGGDQPMFGRWQQPRRTSEVQRHAQARAVRGFVDRLLAADHRANVIVLGDLNDFEFSATTDILSGRGAGALLDLPRTLPAQDRYTYVYQGNSQVLDHILISRALRPRHEYDVVHTNADHPDQDSDHDPQLVRLRLR